MFISEDVKMAKDGYISINEAANYLGVKTITLRNWIKNKKIGVPAYKIGKLWKFKTAELDEWVQSGRSAKVKGDTYSGKD